MLGKKLGKAMHAPPRRRLRTGSAFTDANHRAFASFNLGHHEGKESFEKSSRLHTQALSANKAFRQGDYSQLLGVFDERITCQQKS